MNILLSGAPRSGKTTICRMIMNEVDRTVRGFVTEDIRQEGDRVGFMVEFENGESRVLSHVDFDRPKVGKYGVDLETMDWVVGTVANWDVSDADLFIVDEIGKMELKQEDFPEIVEELLDADVDLLATLPKVGPDFVGEVRSRDDVEKIEVTEATRNETLKRIVERLGIQPVD